VHDFFEILGLPDSAPPSEVRRVCARRTRRSHPDFSRAGSPAGLPDAGARADTGPAPREVAVDFVDMGVVLDRIQASFFGSD
jgi:hypothetical protein